MAMWKRGAALAAILCVAGGMQVALAATPNLNGDWKLNVGKSNYGSFPAPLGATRKIAQGGAKLSMTTVQKSAKGDITTQLNYTTDGKESVNQSQTGESKGTAQWIGDKLMIDSSREVAGTVLKQREIWTLSADGKTLTIDAHVSLPNGEFDVKQVFEKQ